MGVFPVSISCMGLKEEAFLKDVDMISNLKLRVGYGLAGNQDAISSYNSLPLMSPNGTTTVNGLPVVTMGVTRNYNPDLKWESTRQLNIGVDAAFLNGRLSASLDYFDKKTSDMLVEKPYIAVIGEGGYCWYNGGTMNNKGFEMALTWNDKVRIFSIM